MSVGLDASLVRCGANRARSLAHTDSLPRADLLGGAQLRAALETCQESGAAFSGHLIEQLVAALIFNKEMPPEGISGPTVKLELSLIHI